MLSKVISALFVPIFLSSLVAGAAMVDLQTVGASTPLSSKSAICSVKDYGGAADGKTDIGPAILKAYSSCASAGNATIYIPPGNYSLATAVVLNKAIGLAFQIDGLITLEPDGVFNGNAILVNNSEDVEVFSSNGLGAINGQGYQTRSGLAHQNARLIRFYSCSHITVHDLLLIDSPTFHIVFNGVSNLHVYQMTIRGPSIGGTDGVDLECADNCYLHHIQVTNRDECISVKSPSQNVLIEDIYCTASGGMSIGSVTANDVPAGEECAISNITMRNIYAYKCTQMLMIKSFPGGNGAVGYVKDSLFENFISYDSTYGLDIDQYWELHTTPNTGAVALSGLTFKNWTGTVDNGIERGPIVIRGSDVIPITDITLTDFDMWTVNGGRIDNVCKNVYGNGYCAGKSNGPRLAAFTTTMTTTSPPAAFTSPTVPIWALSGFGVTIPIPVYYPSAMWIPASADTTPALTSLTTSPSTTSSATAKYTSTNDAKLPTSTDILVTFTYHSATGVTSTPAPVFITTSVSPSASKRPHKSKYSSEMKSMPISVNTSSVTTSATASAKDSGSNKSITASILETARTTTAIDDCYETDTVTVTILGDFQTIPLSTPVSFPIYTASGPASAAYSTVTSISIPTYTASDVIILSTIAVVPVQASSSSKPGGYYTSAVDIAVSSYAAMSSSASTTTIIEPASTVIITAYECPTSYSRI